MPNPSQTPSRRGGRPSRRSQQLEALFALDERRQRGALSELELSEFTTARDALFAEAGASPVARQLHDPITLASILKADGAQLQPAEFAAVVAALMQSPEPLKLFTALKTIQRTHLTTSTPAAATGTTADTAAPTGEAQG
jgi:hypothetical protein